MTVSTTTPSIRYNYTGPGDYSFLFQILAEDELTVTHISTLGVETVLVYEGASGYSVTTVDGVAGGTCSVSYTETTGFLEIERSTEVSQQVDWQDSGPLSESLIESSFDRDIMILQEFEERLNNYDASIGSSWRGEWATLTEYVGYDAVLEGGGIYICTAAHTAGTFATDLAAGLWVLQFATGVTASISAPNLLYNSKFLENQRAYAADGVDALVEGEYGHDMFLAHSGGVIYTKESNGDITIDRFTSTAGGANDVQLWQRNDEIENASGSITVSFYVVSLTSTIDLYVDDVAVYEINIAGWHTYTFTSAGEPSVGFGKAFVAPQNFDPAFRFNSWKVEQGAVRTTYLTPDTITEKDRCKYNYLDLGAAVLAGRGTSTTVTRFCVLASMNSSITVTGAGNIYDAADVTKAAVSFSDTRDDNTVLVDVTTTAFGDAAGVRTGQFTTLILDANYYS